jgi:lipopolysaccharide/colanic/teichoic acid biosynthesis glycosyltransferase
MAMGILLFVLGLVVFYGITALDTHSNGIFQQARIGRFGQPFYIYKLRTMHVRTQKISLWGRFLRNTKLDELPQLLNILNGEMTFVGPRPDIAGYADTLEAADQCFLKLLPGITGLASLKYRNEAQLLAQQSDPLAYNDTIIWPDKVRINKWYALNRNFFMDVTIVFYTVFPFPFDVDAYIKNRK